MLSGLWNLENVMMMPNTLGLFEQLVPFNFTNFIKDTKKKGSFLFEKRVSLPCNLSPKQL